MDIFDIQNQLKELAAARLDRRSGVGGEGASGNGLRSRQTSWP